MKTKQPLAFITDYIRDRGFLQVGDFFHFALLLIFITYKGTGKSYSAMQECVKLIIRGMNFAWVRNTEIEMLNSRVLDSFTNALESFGVSHLFTVRNNGIYKNNIDNPKDKGLLVGMFLTMNKPFNTASQNALEKCTLIVYDEFINPHFHKKNLFADFMKLAHTLMRKNTAHILLLGNKHESNNDLLSELGVEFDWENGNNQLIHRPDQNLLALYLNKWDINDMSNSNSVMEQFCKYSPSMRNFTQGKISNNNMYGVKNWYINELDKLFVPKFRFDLNDTRYCVGTINDEGAEIVYIRQLDFNDYNNMKTFCYLAKDKLPDNIFIKDIDDLGTVRYLLNNYSRGNLWFSTAYGKEEFKYLLLFLKALLD